MIIVGMGGVVETFQIRPPGRGDITGTARVAGLSNDRPRQQERDEGTDEKGVDPCHCRTHLSGSDVRGRELPTLSRQPEPSRVKRAKKVLARAENSPRPKCRESCLGLVEG